MATPVICYMPLSSGTPVPPGPVSFVAECGVVALLTTQSYIDVLFTFEKPDTDYSLELSVENTVDVPANLLWITLITNRTTTGFRVWFNADAPTINYKLRWCVSTDTPISSLGTEAEVLQFGNLFRIRGTATGAVFETFDAGTNTWIIVNTYTA